MTSQAVREETFEEFTARTRSEFAKQHEEDERGLAEGKARLEAEEKAEAAQAPEDARRWLMANPLDQHKVREFRHNYSRAKEGVYDQITDKAAKHTAFDSMVRHFDLTERSRPYQEAYLKTIWDWAESVLPATVETKKER